MRCAAFSSWGRQNLGEVVGRHGAVGPLRADLVRRRTAHAITVDCGTVGRWELLVIPPDEPARVATRLLTAAADPANPLSAPRLLALAESGLDGQDAGESEGGAGPR